MIIYHDKGSYGTQLDSVVEYKCNTEAGYKYIVSGEPQMKCLYNKATDRAEWTGFNGLNPKGWFYGPNALQCGMYRIVSKVNKNYFPNIKI